MTIYFEDLAVGDEWTSGEYKVTKDEIIEFAEQYDPQWFHTNPERAAEESIYGGLIAAGFHTAAISTRLFVDCFLSDTATLGGKGIDELRWHEPVTPGDQLSIRAEIHELKPETADRGVADIHIETANQDSEVVFSMIALVMFARPDD